MKTPSTFWPVLRSELAFLRYGYAGWIMAGYVALYTALPLTLFLLLFQAERIGNNLALLLQTNVFVIALVVFFLPVMFITFLSTIPALRDFLQANSSSPNAPIPVPPVGTTQDLEFQITRAMDRIMLCRARTVAFFISALLPFFLFVAAAPFTPDLHLNLNHTPDDQLDSQIKLYSDAFPAMHPLVEGRRSLPGQFVVPHGALVYTVWLVWLAALLLSLCRAYGTLMANWVKPGRWWTFTPLAFPFLLIPRLLAFTFTRQERGFLFFATHLLPMIAALIVLAIVIQLWCEHRFRKMEII
jgi:hypothetical protein